MYRIGIDLGGTNIAVGIVNEQYHIVGRSSVPTGSCRPYMEIVNDIYRAVELALSSSNVKTTDCSQIGIGAPGTCDSTRGIVYHAYNLGLNDIPICRFLQEKFGIPVFLSNDANCAALGEAVAGKAAGYNNSVLITLGTGVGSGIIINRNIYAGMRSAGAEFGHTLIAFDGKLCTCGRRGCWEAYASATALIQQAEIAALASPESLLNKCPSITGKTVFDIADRGDITAKNVVAQWCDYVAAGVTNIVNALAPDIILIGGGISRQGERILVPIREYVSAHCFGQEEGPIPVIDVAGLGNDAGIIGAAVLH